MKTTQVSINRWMDRENVVYIYTMEHHSTKKKKKNENLPFVTTWINLEGIMLSEISQLEKDKYYLISPIMQNLKN